MELTAIFNFYFLLNVQLQYGEIRSLWQLLQIPEFQTLFLFHQNTVFPSLNGTCGSLYAMEMVYQNYLYDKGKPSYLDKVFPNRYCTLPHIIIEVHFSSVIKNKIKKINQNTTLF